MNATIYQSPRFIKQLHILSKGNKEESRAVERAEKIIELLSNGLPGTEALRSKMTRHGELRMNDCLKFDLGSGYRMIVLNKKTKFYVLFVGNHDDCDRWLDLRRRNKVRGIITDKTFPVRNGPQPSNNHHLQRKIPTGDCYEEQLMAKVDDKVLRRVFKGICSK